jgi:hypothetical protein
MPTYLYWIIASITLVLLIVVILKIRFELRYKKWLRALEHEDLFVVQRSFSKPFVEIIEYLCVKKNHKVIDLFNAYLFALKERFNELSVSELNTAKKKKKFLEKMGYCSAMRTFVQSMKHFDSSVAEQWDTIIGTELHIHSPVEEHFFLHQRAHLELLYLLEQDSVLINRKEKIVYVENSIRQFMIASYAVIEKGNYQCKPCNLMRMFLDDPIIDALCAKNKAFKEEVMTMRKKLAIQPVSLM